MAQFLRANGDSKPVMNFDGPVYQNDAVTFTGEVTAPTLISVTNPSTTAFVAGQTVSGAGIPAGVVVVSYAAGVLTVGGTLLTAAPGVLVSMAARTAFVVGATVQPQGPKLDFWTLTIAANQVEQALQVLAKRATVHIYKVASATSLHVAVYDTAGWDAALIAAEGDGIITAVAAGATFGV